MQKKIFYLFLLGFFLIGCVPMANRPVAEAAAPVSVTETVVQRSSTPTPAPTATITATPTPDFSLIGLRTEQEGELALDFVEQMCAAQWFTRGQQLTCPGNDDQRDMGYVMHLDAEVQGLPSNLNLMLTYPPQTDFETISSKYPAFTVQKGDRFRAVLTCRAHSFCDVEFVLDYFDDRGQVGLKQWRYLFADDPIVVDYPLDSIAGKTVQFDLAVQAKGNRPDASAVWIVPHIYRPAP